MFRIAVGLVVAVACVGCSGYGTKMTFNGGELYRTSAVTEDEAERLGQYLIRAGFFDGARKTVQLNKEDGEYQVRLVIKPEFQDNADYIQMLEMFGVEVREEVFPGETVVVHVCDDRLKTVRTVAALQSYVANKGTICYSEGVTKPEVEKLAKLLVADQFFDGNPKTIRLDRSGDGYELTMSVQAGVVLNAADGEAIKQMPGELSQGAFDGKPVTLVVCDPTGRRERFSSSR